MSSSKDYPSPLEQRQNRIHQAITLQKPDQIPILLEFGTSEEVQQYRHRLIQALGSSGFILHSGCDIPYGCSIGQCPGHDFRSKKRVTA